MHVAEVDSPPARVFSIMPHSRGEIYCTADLGLCLSKVDPQDGRAEVLGITANASGEIYGNAEAPDGRVYGVSYTHAVLTVYAPERGWAPGREPSSNPRCLGSPGEQQYRPVTGILTGPGGKFYVGTVPEYGSRGGALTVIDPTSDTWTVRRHLVPDHSVHGVAVDDALVYVGTSVQADGYIEPVGGDAHFLAFDPEEARVTVDRRVAGAESVFAMGVARGTVCFWTRDHDGGRRLLVCEGPDGELREQQVPAGIGAVHRWPMVRTEDGRLFFGHTAGVAEMNHAEGRVTPVWDAGEEPWGGALAAWGRRLLLSVGNRLFVLEPT